MEAPEMRGHLESSLASVSPCAGSNDSNENPISTLLVLEVGLGLLHPSEWPDFALLGDTEPSGIAWSLGGPGLGSPGFFCGLHAKWVPITTGHSLLPISA